MLKWKFLNNCKLLFLIHVMCQRRNKTTENWKFNLPVGRKMNYGQLRLILEEILAKADAAEHMIQCQKKFLIRIRKGACVSIEQGRIACFHFFSFWFVHLYVWLQPSLSITRVYKSKAMKNSIFSSVKKWNAKKCESYAEAHTVRATLCAWIITNNLTPRKKEC